jgi:hypothetical protein
MVLSIYRRNFFQICHLQRYITSKDCICIPFITIYLGYMCIIIYYVMYTFIVPFTNYSIFWIFHNYLELCRGNVPASRSSDASSNPTQGVGKSKVCGTTLPLPYTLLSNQSYTYSIMSHTRYNVQGEETNFRIWLQLL